LDYVVQLGGALNDGSPFELQIEYKSQYIKAYYLEPSQTWSAYVLSLLGLIGTFFSVTGLIAAYVAILVRLSKKKNTKKK